MKSLYIVFFVLLSYELISTDCLYSQNRDNIPVYYPEIKAIPDFDSIQSTLDDLWSRASIVEKKLESKGFSFDNFAKICQDLGNYTGNGYHAYFGITPDEFDILSQVYCFDLVCCGTVCLPKSAYEIEAYEWINPCDDLEPMPMGGGGVAAV